MKFNHCLTLNAKNQLKMDNDLNVRPETIKRLKENAGGKLLDIGLGNDFFVFRPKI